MKNLDNVFILVPMYNEEDQITKTIENLKSVFKNILVINDGSSDKSLGILDKLNVNSISHPINLGQGASIKTGFQYLSSIDECHAVITFDADGQHILEDAKDLAEKILNDEEEIIFGSRFLLNKSKIPILKKLLLLTAVSITKFIIGINLTDTHNGLKAFKKSVLNKVDIQIDRYGFESELLKEVVRKDISYKEHSVTVIYSDYSKKKGQSYRNALVIFEDLIRFWK